MLEPVALALGGEGSLSGLNGIAAPDGSTPGKQWLFVIGINKYQDWRAWPELDSAMRDAQAVRDVLMQRYHVDEVIELYDADATLAGIVDQLRRLAEQAEQSDSVLIYYAGHGHLDKSDL